MFNHHPSSESLPYLNTQQIQTCLEENCQLILTIMEGINKKKYTEVALCEARLQKNLNFLVKLAEVYQSSLVVMQQGHGSQHPHMAMSQQQPDVPMLPFQLNDHQPQSKQQLFQQQQLMQGQLNRFPGANFGNNQSPQTRLGINLSGKQDMNQLGLDAISGGSLGKSPLGRDSGNT